MNRITLDALVTRHIFSVWQRRMEALQTAGLPLKTWESQKITEWELKLVEKGTKRWAVLCI